MADLPNIFGQNIAQQINNAMGSLLLPAILIKVTYQDDPNDSSNVIKIRTPHNCRGFKEAKTVRDANGTLVQINSDVISILGASLPGPVTPEPGDEITIENSTREISPSGVSRDPAGALFQCIVA